MVYLNTYILYKTNVYVSQVATRAIISIICGFNGVKNAMFNHNSWLGSVTYKELIQIRGAKFDINDEHTRRYVLNKIHWGHSRRVWGRNIIPTHRDGFRNNLK